MSTIRHPTVERGSRMNATTDDTAVSAEVEEHEDESHIVRGLD